MARNEGLSNWGYEDDDADSTDVDKVSSDKKITFNLSSYFRDQSEKANNTLSVLFGNEEEKRQLEEGKSDKKKKKKKKNGLLINSEKVDVSEVNTVDDNENASLPAEKNDSDSRNTEKANKTSAESEVSDSEEQKPSDDVWAGGEQQDTSVSIVAETESRLKEVRERINQIEQKIAGRHLVKKDTEPLVHAEDRLLDDVQDELPKTYGGARFGFSAKEKSITEDHDLKTVSEITSNNMPEDFAPSKASSTEFADVSRSVPPITPPPFNPNMYNPYSYLGGNKKDTKADLDAGIPIVDNPNIEVNNYEINNRPSLAPSVIAFLGADFFSRRRDRRLAKELKVSNRKVGKRFDNIEKKAERISSEVQASQANTNIRLSEAESLGSIINRSSRAGSIEDGLSMAERKIYPENQDGGVAGGFRRSATTEIMTNTRVADKKSQKINEKVGSENRVEVQNLDEKKDNFRESIFRKVLKRDKKQFFAPVINNQFVNQSEKTLKSFSSLLSQPSVANLAVQNSGYDKPMSAKDYKDAIVTGSAVGIILLITFMVVYYYLG